MACGLSLATYSDMRRACQVFRMEEMAEKLGFEFTLDLLGDDQVAGATRSANADRTVRSAAAVLKNHARSYMKQARKDGLTLLQRLGTDAHFAYNCAVQDLTPRCMHWVTVLGNLVLPSVNRTREEIQSGRMRQFKARICIVAWDTSVPNQEIAVDEQVLVWYKNRFYRANQFIAIYAQFDPRERFPCLSAATEPFISDGTVQRASLPGLRRLRGPENSNDNWGYFDARRKPSHPQSTTARSNLQQVFQARAWFSSRILPWILPAGMERLLQSVVGLRMGGVASTQSGTAVSRWPPRISPLIVNAWRKPWPFVASSLQEVLQTPSGSFGLS